MPLVYDELGAPEPAPDPDAPGFDPAATQAWSATRWDDGGGIAQDNLGNTVIFDRDGTVATATPTGSSVTRPDGTADEDRFDTVEGAASGGEDGSE